MMYNSYDPKYIVKHMIDCDKMFDEYLKFGPFPLTGELHYDRINKYNEFFHEYPYDEIDKAVWNWTHQTFKTPYPYKNASAYSKLQIESAINYNDFKDSLEYICCRIKGDNEKAEEVKQRILDKVARRKQGYLEERGDDPVLDCLVESGLLSAETSRNVGNGYIGFSVWNGVKWVEQFQKMR